MRVYHYLESKWGLDDLRRRRLKLSRIDDMNDPYEWRCVCSHDPLSQAALEMTGRQTCDQFGVACFGRSSDNLLMWSHYGDRHKGVCLGFDVPDNIVREVQYVSEVELIGNFYDLPPTELNAEGTRIINKLFDAKYDGWSYENEVRVHGTRVEIDKESGLYFVDFSDHLQLKEVIAGARFSMSKKVIEDALQGYSEEVTVSKAVITAEKFEVVIDERGFATDAGEEVQTSLASGFAG